MKLPTIAPSDILRISSQSMASWPGRPGPQLTLSFLLLTSYIYVCMYMSIYGRGNGLTSGKKNFQEKFDREIQVFFIIIYH